MQGSRSSIHHGIENSEYMSCVMLGMTPRMPHQFLAETKQLSIYMPMIQSRAASFQEYWQGTHRK